MTDIVEPTRPEEIETRSFAIIEEETGPNRPFARVEWLVVRRMIHTSADFQLLDLVRFHPEAVRAGIEALRRGCLVITDTEMARAGVSTGRLERLECRAVCYIREPEVAERARTEETTRASAAVDHAVPELDGAVYLVGNAPTALLRLLHLVDQGTCAPALIIGMPVGFVNAAESKDLLAGQDRVPYITVRGRKGGSPLAAAVLNQLSLLALEARDEI
jgi:precorrin-8X/cobalt-precorrin-8 methylmutase